MHRAQAVADLALKGLAAATVSSKALGAAEASSLKSAVDQDARDAIYSGALTIAEAIQGLDRHLYTWATVKLYYSVFYFARAALALQGTCVFYVNSTPYSWLAAPGEVPKKRAGNTHKVVLDVFRMQLSTHVLLSQPIGVDEPHTWLMSKREAANYRIARFREPDAPDHFKFVERHGVRQPVRDYLADNGHLFTFDPDHAMLSFPIAAMRDALSLLKQGGSGLSQDDSMFIAGLCRDRTGPVPEFRKLLLT